MSINYFQVLDIEQGFEIDKVTLKDHYNSLIKEYHPDNFAADSAQELQALEQTALLNEAFKVLNDDLLRANYLLELHNINAFDALDTGMDGAFLMMQITLQEELEELNTEEGLEDFLDRIHQHINEHTRQISQYFAENNLEKARNAVRELKFFYQLRMQTEKKLDTFL